MSLPEVAIVLGIVGLVIGAIWIAAAAVSRNMKISETHKGIISTATALQQAWPVGTPNPAVSVTTGEGRQNAYAIAAKLVPADWIKGVNIIRDPWGNAVNIDFGASYLGVAYSRNWIIELSNISQADCYYIYPLLAKYIGTQFLTVGTGEVGDNYSGSFPGNCDYNSNTKIIIFIK